MPSKELVLTQAEENVLESLRNNNGSRFIAYWDEDPQTWKDFEVLTQLENKGLVTSCFTSESASVIKFDIKEVQPV